MLKCDMCGLLETALHDQVKQDCDVNCSMHSAAHQGIFNSSECNTIQLPNVFHYHAELRVLDMEGS